MQKNSVAAISGVDKKGGREPSPPIPNPPDKTVSIRSNCTKFAKLVSLFSGKYLKLLPPCRSYLLKLKCPKFDFG